MAAVIKNARNGNDQNVPGAETIAETLANRLKAEHPRFNVERFLEACGIEVNQ